MRRARLPLLAALAAAAAALPATGCDCLTLQAATLTVRSDCSGAPTDDVYAFVIGPNLVPLDEVEEKLGVELPIDCDVDPEKLLQLECDLVGAGASENEQAAAVLCGGALTVAGAVDGTTLFRCVAERPYGAETLFPMRCEYRAAAGGPATGPQGDGCRAIASLEILAGVGD